MKKIIDHNAPQTLSGSESDEPAVLDSIQVSPLSIKKYPDFPKSPSDKIQYQSYTAIPDYLSADKIDSKVVGELDYKLNPSLPMELLNHYPMHLNSYTDSFTSWTEMLMQDFNLALYGIGSKIEILTNFQSFLASKDYNIIRVNAYNPIVTPRKILNEILKFFDKSLKTSSSVDKILSIVLELLSELNTDIFLLIDSLDGSSIIDSESQLIISRISNHTKIHLVATFDNAYLLYRWSIKTNINYNFLYIPVPTVNAYNVELSFSEGLKVFDYSSTHNKMRGIDYVLKSMTRPQKLILRELAYIQLKDSGGISFKDFLNKCIEETHVLNAKQLKDLLIEAIDHQIAAYKIGPKGENMIYLKIDPIILTNKIN